MKCHPISKKLPLYIILNHFYRNGLDPNATVALASCVKYTMSRYFISYILYSVELLGYTQDSTFHIMTDLFLVKLMSYIDLLIGDVMCLIFLMCVIYLFSHFINHLYIIKIWWRHQMETFSALLAICAGNSPVSGEIPAQRPVTRSFDVFFDLRLNKRLSKQSWGWWFETLSRPLWRHCNELSQAPLPWRHNARTC